MATTLNTIIETRLDAALVNLLELSKPIDRLPYVLKTTLAQGTQENQANRIWHDQRTLVDTSETLDLTARNDPLGNPISFAKIKALVIHNRQLETARVLTIGGAATLPWYSWLGAADDKVKVGPHGLLLVIGPVDGYALGGSKNLLIAAAGSILFDIIVIGTSA